MEEPPWLKRLNRLERCCGNPNYLLNVDFDKLVKVAEDTTNLTNFGDDSWTQYYEASLNSIKAIAHKSPLLCVILKSQLLIRLRNRLFIVQKITENPCIKNEQIDSPIIITGLPRSGTTILFELLNQDPDLRAPLGYETIQTPLSKDGLARNNNYRKEIAECLFDLNMDIAPNLREMHDNRNELPAECAEIMTNALTFPHPKIDAPGDYQSRISSYLDDSRYKWHKMVLQTLQHESKKSTWVLKDLFHIHFLELVFATYPNARIIHTHRDPVSVIPSLLSLLNTMSKIYPEYKIKNIQQAISFFEGGLKKSISQRVMDTSLNKKIIDIQFSKLITNPKDIIESCYQKFNIEYTDETRSRIAKYIKERPREKYGKHTYNLNDYGLSEKSLRKQFQFYTDYYQIR